jgi:membrane protein required for beta-lactamase induction
MIDAPEKDGDSSTDTQRSVFAEDWSRMDFLNITALLVGMAFMLTLLAIVEGVPYGVLPLVAVLFTVCMYESGMMAKYKHEVRKRVR